MLSARTAKILKHITEQYIEKAIPVSSQTVAASSRLGLSSATIRNEMALLEEEGYIIRPHISAGSVPSDKGYRAYVDSLESTPLPPVKRRLISHLFDQAHREAEEWVGLTANLLAHLARNVAVVSTPKSADCKFKYLELVALQDMLTLVVLVLYGATVKQKLISLKEAVPQSKLVVTANKLNAAYSSLNQKQIAARKIELSPFEEEITGHVTTMMRTEDEQEAEPHLDGLHFIVTQPEFEQSQRMRPLIELVEHRNLLKIIVPRELSQQGVHVIIGKENRAEAIRDYSVIISHYGLPEEATGTIGVVGPTRMSYVDAISTVDYLSTLLSEMMGMLYGREPARPQKDSTTD